MKIQAILFDYTKKLLNLYQSAMNKKITPDEYEDKLIMLIKNYELKIKNEVRKGTI